MRKSLLALLFYCVAPSLPALEIDDFAYQARVGDSEIDSDSMLRRIELPLDVMLGTTSPGVSDVAVFNVDGKKLPHTVQRTRDRYLKRSLELPFHRFDRFLQQRERTVTRREQNQQENSIEETQTTETIAVQSVRSDYLVELQPEGRQQRYESLELKWQHEPASQMLELRVEVGNEIDRLRTIRPRTSLTNIDSGEPDWRSIRGIPPGNRYLRLIPLDAVTRFELERVKGNYLEKKPAPLLIHSIEPGLEADDGEERYQFRYPSVHTPEIMRIIPADDRDIISGDLYYSSRVEPDKRLVLQRGFRQHNIDDDEIKPSRPFNMTRVYPHELWFTTGSKLAAAPRVELSYAQHEVIFLADGNGPYRLAWGNSEPRGSKVRLREMLQIDLTDPEKWGVSVPLGPIEQAGGPSRLEPKRSLPWKKWLLWALLALAAMVTARMAVRLYQEMNQPQS